MSGKIHLLDFLYLTMSFTCSYSHPLCIPSKSYITSTTFKTSWTSFVPSMRHLQNISVFGWRLWFGVLACQMIRDITWSDCLRSTWGFFLVYQMLPNRTNNGCILFAFSLEFTSLFLYT